MAGGLASQDEISIPKDRAIGAWSGHPPHRCR